MHINNARNILKKCERFLFLLNSLLPVDQTEQFSSETQNTKRREEAKNRKIVYDCIFSICFILTARKFGMVLTQLFYIQIMILFF